MSAFDDLRIQPTKISPGRETARVLISMEQDLLTAVDAKVADDYRFSNRSALVRFLLAEYVKGKK
jgi:metal-responsive CopG/Arc/MetJ family transcriptional regulator